MIKNGICKHIFLPGLEFGHELDWNYRPSVENNHIYSRRDWIQTLVTKINQMSAKIFQRTLSGGADTIRVSDDISILITELEYFKFGPYTPNNIGTLGGRFNVIIDNSVPRDEIWVTKEDLSRFISRGDYYIGIYNTFLKNSLKGRIKITHND
jgi:hypothetical protein